MRWIGVGIVVLIFSVALGFMTFGAVMSWRGEDPADMLDGWFNRFIWKYGTPLMGCGIAAVVLIMSWVIWSAYHVA